MPEGDGAAIDVYVGDVEIELLEAIDVPEKGSEPVSIEEKRGWRRNRVYIDEKASFISHKSTLSLVMPTDCRTLLHEKQNNSESASKTKHERMPA
jgi:hypothetical protein